jgi:hypothetical protein
VIPPAFGACLADALELALAIIPKSSYEQSAKASLLQGWAHGKLRAPALV